MLRYIIALLLLSSPFFANERESFLITHVQNCIERGWNEQSKLDKKILKIEGMSSSKVRHFLNNLCSLPNASYLEIGCWKGSTWVSALYQNQLSMASAIAIDNWSGFGGPKDVFYLNSARFLGNFGYQIYSGDCFKVDLQSLFQRPVNIYLYDGDHSALSQEKAFTYYNDVLDDVFIAVVDDWNWREVKQGTRSAFKKLNYEILYEEALPARAKGSDRELWWNGYYVAVIRKSRLF